jgi:hypothetical protein
MDEVNIIEFSLQHIDESHILDEVSISTSNRFGLNGGETSHKPSTS